MIANPPPQPRRVGRPKADLKQRLSQLLGRLSYGVMIPLGEEMDLSGWPNVSLPCWEGPSKIWFNGRPTTTVRAVFALIFDVEDMHPTWRAVRGCLNPKCQNPHHHSVELINRKDGTPVEPLPVAAAFEASKRIEMEVDETEDAMDMILMVDGGREMPAEDLVARFGGAYDHDTVTRALERIHAQGL